MIFEGPCWLRLWKHVLHLLGTTFLKPGFEVYIYAIGKLDGRYNVTSKLTIAAQSL